MTDIKPKYVDGVWMCSKKCPRHGVEYPCYDAFINYPASICIPALNRDLDQAIHERDQYDARRREAIAKFEALRVEHQALKAAFERGTAMSDKPLRPCPFCGGSNLEVSDVPLDAPETLVAVWCEDCGCYGPYTCLSHDDALDSWNARAENRLKSRKWAAMSEIDWDCFESEGGDA